MDETAGDNFVNHAIENRAPGTQGPRANNLTKISLGILRVAIFLAVISCLIIPNVPEKFLHLRENGLTIYIIRAPGTHLPLNIAWPFEGFKNINIRPLTLAVIAILSSSLTLPGSDYKWFTCKKIRIPKWVIVLIISVVTLGLSILFRVDYEKNKTFSDGRYIPISTACAQKIPGEPLTFIFFNGIYKFLLLLLKTDAPVTAVQIASYLCGAIFVAGIYLFVDAAVENKTARTALFAGGVLVGTTIHFLGYVENTPLILATITFFLGAAAQTLRASSARAKFIWATVTSGTAGLASLAHGGGIFVLPALAYIFNKVFILATAETKPKVKSGVKPYLLPALIFFFTVLVPYFIANGTSYIGGDYGNLKGGGDGIMFVPWKYPPGPTKSPFLYYTLFSPAHLFDIAGVLTVGAPFSLPLCIATVLLVFSKTRKWSDFERRLAITLGIAAAPCIAVPLIWHHDYGMWGDWNIACCYLFPFHLFSWYIFVTTSRTAFPADKGYLRLLFTLAVTQLFLALGLYFQLR